MNDPSRVQDAVDTELTRLFRATPAPQLSPDFETRLSARLRELPLVAAQTGTSADRATRRRWIMRLYWAAAAVVAMFSGAHTMLEPAQAQTLALVAIVMVFLMQRMMHPWSLSRIIGSAIR